jgi:hypothetical protein
MQTAIQALDTEMRKTLLDEMPDDYSVDQIITAIVGNSIEVYQHLLASSRLRNFHLLPVVSLPSEDWAPMAMASLDAGYRPEDLVGASRSRGVFWGPESATLQRWIDGYTDLLRHPDSRIRRIAELGIEQTVASRTRALERERQRAIYGYE